MTSTATRQIYWIASGPGISLVVTIDRKAELVVQGAEPYPALPDRVETIERIQRGLADVKAGRTKPAR